MVLPELPEVETIRRGLEPQLLGKTCCGAEVGNHRVLVGEAADGFSDALAGEQIAQLGRRGKYLIIYFRSHNWLVIHLRMTGRLLYSEHSDLVLGKHTALILPFSGNGQLRLEDQRKFATVQLARKGNVRHIRGLAGAGMEPLESGFTVQRLTEVLMSRSPVKTLLLDQSRIAGLGNIYADEALFRAQIHPAVPGNGVGPAAALLHRSIQTVLEDALEAQGTSLRDYRTGQGELGRFQNELLVYGRQGQPCSRCGATIKRIRIGGRSSHFCPACQLSAADRPLAIAWKEAVT